ncbi:DUF6514 family protein [Haloimpatiens sp. FM7315]|uniref:DUF6514 family protein n=1 Tax=Haloimpatiens sp. FM7315 TaxID=3298609 RepID=UPI0035A353A2
MIVVENVEKQVKSSDVVRNYYYRLIKDEISVYFGQTETKIQAYGVEVERQDVVDERVVNIERECVTSISPYRHKVHNLMKILYDNIVSPVHVLEIIGSEVDFCVEDFDYELKNILTC